MIVRRAAPVLGLTAMSLVAANAAGTSSTEPAPDLSTNEATIRRASQLVVVVTDTWRSHTGTLRRYSRGRTTWDQKGEATPVALGRNGLAWGRGLLDRGTDQHALKREGDGKSPAGIFSLGTAFGAANELPTSSHGYPYLPVTETNYCVEDTRSDFYNEIIDANTIQSSGWQQWSPLARPDGLFRWGVFVNQNKKPIQIGAGSCIFLHVWRGPDTSTAGCTAMTPEAIRELVRWLDPQAHPLLVQLPRETYLEFAAEYALPQGDVVPERTVPTGDGG